MRTALVSKGAAAASVVIAGGVIPALAFALVYRFTVDFPFWDEWGIAPIIVAADRGHWDLGALNSQAHEHRVFFPAFVIFMLSRLGGWSVLRESLFAVAILTLSLAVLWRMAERTLPPAVLPYAFLCVSLLAFSLVQYEDLFWPPGGIGWFTPNLAAIVSIWMLAAPRVTWLKLAVGFSACFVASFSAAFGMSTLAAGALLLTLAKPLDWQRLAVWCLACAALLALFFHGYNQNPLEPGAPISGSTFWPNYPLYVLVYLSSPLGYWPGPGLSEGLGILLLLGFVLALAVAVMSRVRDRSIENELPWIGLSAYAVLCALVTAYGRSGLGIGQALSSRYTVLATDAWIGLGMLAVLGAGALLRARRPPASWVFGGCFVFGLAFAACYAQTQYRSFGEAQEFVGLIHTSALALNATPYPTDEALRQLYPDARQLRGWLAELAAVHERPFTELPK